MFRWTLTENQLPVSLLQHDDDDDPEDIPTEDLPIGISSVGIPYDDV